MFLLVRKNMFHQRITLIYVFKTNVNDFYLYYSCCPAARNVNCILIKNDTYFPELTVQAPHRPAFLCI